MQVRMLKRGISWLLLLTLALEFLTGFGITNAPVVTPLSFGLLGKALSYQIHMLLWGPLAILAAAHVYLNVVPRDQQ